MNQKKLVFLIFFLSVLLFGIFYVSADLSSGLVSTCGNINSAGVYTLNQSIESDGTCIIIDSDNVVLNGAGHNITYNKVFDQLQHGILVNNHHTNITIKNFAGIDNFDTVDSGDNNGIMVHDGIDYSVITNNTINSYGSYGSNGDGDNCMTFVDGGYYGFTPTNNFSYNNITYNHCNSKSEGFSFYSDTASNNIILGNVIYSDYYSLDFFWLIQNNLIENNIMNSNLEETIFSNHYSLNNSFINNIINSSSTCSLNMLGLSQNDFFINNTMISPSGITIGTIDNSTLENQDFSPYTINGLSNITFIQNGKTFYLTDFIGSGGSLSDSVRLFFTTSQSSYQSNSIYQFMNSSGAGLGIFMQIMGIVLSVIIPLFALIGVMLIIGFSIVSLIKHNFLGIK